MTPFWRTASLIASPRFWRSFPATSTSAPSDTAAPRWRPWSHIRPNSVFRHSFGISRAVSYSHLDFFIHTSQATFIVTYLQITTSCQFMLLLCFCHCCFHHRFPTSLNIFRPHRYPVFGWGTASARRIAGSGPCRCLDRAEDLLELGQCPR